MLGHRMGCGVIEDKSGRKVEVGRSLEVVAQFKGGQRIKSEVFE
ncbi:hypothetical protein MPS_5642 [Mycobacterium pseudoshottsii JCM 15466]|nr:hypothetical protein MPS_5642 [Mycobacterium pseudoshottsii JCM 15466]